MANLILGIGGTGAKVVESFIHLCATGLGPQKQVSVACIDQDQGNGNTDRTLRTLERYKLAREALRAWPKADHRDPEACDLLRTKLNPLSNEKGNCNWAPHGGDSVTLAELIGYERTDSKSMDIAEALFLGKSELSMNLNKGYRGRPHVGSAAFLADKSNPFWKKIDDLLGKEKTNGVRVFLCGSAFGGTGAAILPTLARSLRRKGKSDLRTGTSLMLPYFSFYPPSEADANVAVSNQLGLQARAALEYYAEPKHVRTEGKLEHSFDEIYLVGWNPLIKLTYHCEGSQEQKNPPLAPELFAALAAARFFREPWKKGSGGVAENVYYSAREAVQLEWEDLPAVPALGHESNDAEEVDRDNEEKADVGVPYATWLRFCALWAFNYAQGLHGRPDASSEAWFRRHVGEASQDKNEYIKSLGDYVSTALRYAAAMSKFSTWGDDAKPFNLWSHSPIASIGTSEDKAPPTPMLKEGALAESFRGNFSQLLRGSLKTGGSGKSEKGKKQIEKQQGEDAARVYWELASEPSVKSKQSRGLWRLVANLYKCSAPRDLSPTTDEEG